MKFLRFLRLVPISMGAHRLLPCSHLSHRKKRLSLRFFGWNLSLRDCRQGTWHHWGPWRHTCTRVSLNSRMPVWFLAELLATCMSWKLIRKKPLFSPGSIIYNIICLCIYKCKKYYMCCTYHINVILIILSWTFNAPPAPFFSVCFAPLLVGPHRRHRFHGSSKVDNARLSIPPPPEPADPRPRPNVVPRLKHVQTLRWRWGKVKISNQKMLYLSHLEAQNEWFKASFVLKKTDEVAPCPKMLRRNWAEDL